MSDTQYILSITDKGVLPDEDSELIKKLEEKFVDIRKIWGTPWYLTQEGLNERNYRAKRDSQHPLTSKEKKELKQYFRDNKRNLHIHMIQEI